MKLRGIHHITAITANAQANLDFYVLVLGLRLVKKTINYDLPDVYHLYYGDDAGSPGTILTFFEFPGIEKGRAGPGMIHSIRWRVAREESLGFWGERLGSFGIECIRRDGTLLFSDPEGLSLQITSDGVSEDLMRSVHEDIPMEHALGGFAGVGSYVHTPGRTSELLQATLGFTEQSDGKFELDGHLYEVERAASPPGIQGAGSVHHIAWACAPEEQQLHREQVTAAGVHVTPVIDRTYFRSIYFREPGGVLFEIATIGPGFDVDEPMESLGESLALPSRYEHMRDQLEARLTPLVNPRERV